VSARVLALTGIVLLAISASTARACNVTADADHAVRMAGTAPARSAVSAVSWTPKSPLVQRSHLRGYRH
jgi:hypothetical protein